MDTALGWDIYWVTNNIVGGNQSQSIIASGPPSSAVPDSVRTRLDAPAPFGRGPGNRPWGNKEQTYLLPIREDIEFSERMIKLALQAK